MYVIKIKFMCYKDKFILPVSERQIYMLYKQNLYVIKTKFICCRDKKHGARAERARRGFFLPKKRHFIVWEHNIAVLVLCSG